MGILIQVPFQPNEFSKYEYVLKKYEDDLDFPSNFHINEKNLESSLDMLSIDFDFVRALVGGSIGKFIGNSIIDIISIIDNDLDPSLSLIKSSASRVKFIGTKGANFAPKMMGFGKKGMGKAFGFAKGKLSHEQPEEIISENQLDEVDEESRWEEILKWFENFGLMLRTKLIELLSKSRDKIVNSLVSKIIVNGRFDTQGLLSSYIDVKENNSSNNDRFRRIGDKFHMSGLASQIKDKAEFVDSKLDASAGKIDDLLYTKVEKISSRFGEQFINNDFGQTVSAIVNEALTKIDKELHKSGANMSLRVMSNTSIIIQEIGKCLGLVIGKIIARIILASTGLSFFFVSKLGIVKDKIITYIGNIIGARVGVVLGKVSRDGTNDMDTIIMSTARAEPTHSSAFPNNPDNEDLEEEYRISSQNTINELFKREFLTS